MFILGIKFFLGVVLLLFSTHAFVKLAEKISRAIQISPLIIGTTVVALGTSLPELAVSLVASIKGDTGLAIGNIIGSNITNIFMVLPAGILIGKLRIGTTKTQRNALILLAITALFVLLQKLSLTVAQIKPGFEIVSSLFVGLFFLALAVLITFEEYELGVFGRNHEDSLRFNNHNKRKFTMGRIILLFFSMSGIILGGILVVSSVEGISATIGYSTTVLGLSLTAIATSLPELLTTIFSQEENQEKITIGNIIGSNVYNLLFIGGLVMFFPAVTPVSTRDWIWLIFATVFFVFILRYYSGKVIPRWVGIFLLLLFFVYLFTLHVQS